MRSIKFRRMGAFVSIILLMIQLLSISNVALAANPAGNLDQCANKGTVCDTSHPSQWQNGNLGQSQAIYNEGDSVPYRLVFTDLTAGSTYTTRIEWDTTQNGKHALDYLTTYNRTVTTADPWAGLTPSTPPTPSTIAIPTDPNVTGAGVTPVAGNFTLFGGTFPSGALSGYTLSGPFTGNSQTSISITFVASNSTAVLAWGGHIATRKDWGANLSAVAISGSPYHMRFLDLNGSGGNQDRSLSAEAVIFPGSITIIKDDTSNTGTSFSFTDTGGLTPTSFTLSDDGTNATNQNKQVFSNITNFTTYTITEGTLPTDWTLASINCSVTSPNGGTQSTSGSTETIKLAEGEDVTCTYSNSFNAKPALSLTKTATPTTYSKAGDVISYSYTVTNTGNITLKGPVTVADNKATVTCPAGDLAPGASTVCTASYTITQADVDAGSVTNKATASASGTKSNEATATVTATQTSALTLTKTPSPTTYSKVGDVINYSYVLKNTGNVTLSSPFAVSDDKASVTCPDTASLAPNATITCTASYTITQADLDAGKVINKATATAKFGSNTVTSNEATATVTAAQNAALSLTKTANPVTYDKVGQSIGYSYVLKNTGNVTLSSPFAVSDDKASVTCPATASLAPNATITCTATYAITQGDLDSGSVTNTATATAKFGDNTVTSNQAQATVKAVQGPALSLVKTASPLTYDSLGQVISYSYLVTNSGNVTLAGPVTVTDDKATVTCPALDVAGFKPGASITCTASYTITQADLDSGSVTNKATATANGTTSNEATQTVTATQKPALSIDKTAAESTYSKAGDTIHYSYLVTNSGNVTLVDPVIVTDDKATVTCPALDVAGLKPGVSITCTATYTVTQADVDSGSLTNIAFAKSGSTQSPTDTLTIPAVQTPAISLTKAAEEQNYSKVGDIIHYTLVATNTGNVTLTNVSIIDPKLGTLTCTPAQPATLAPGDSMTCKGTYTISQSDLDAGKVENLATASGNPPSGPAVSANAGTSVPAIQAPAMTLTKVGTLDMTVVPPADRADAGDVIYYALTATNTGNLTLNNVFISDPMLPSLACEPVTLVPGASLTCTGSYTITQQDIDAGHVGNTATGTNNETPPVITHDDVPIPQVSTLSLAKTPAPATYSKVGEVISYSYDLKNTGNVTLSSPFAVTDNKVTVTCPSSPMSLAPNATITCTATYTIKQGDLDLGFVNNLATATAMFGSNTVTSNEATATVTGYKSPALELTKVGTLDTTVVSPADRADAGDVIHYTLTATNTGNVTLTGVTISDSLLPVLTCTPTQPATLAPNASLACTGSYVLTQKDIDAGHVGNIATGISDQTPPTTTSTDVPLPQTPAISLTKAAQEQSYSNAGDVIHYTLVATNTGNVTLTSVSISDPMLPALTCTPPQPATLAPGTSMSCTASYTITQSDVDAGKVFNSATASGTPPSGTPVTDKASTTVTATQGPALSLTKKADPASYSSPGTTIFYSYTATNTGNVTLTGPVKISDDKLGSFDCGIVSYLTPGASVTCSNAYVTTQADLDNGDGSIKNTAKASATFGSDPVFSNEATAIVTAAKSPAMTLTKSGMLDMTVVAPGDRADVGDIIHYTLTATNTGNVTLTNVSISDPMLPVLTCTPAQPATLAPGATLVCTGSYAITQKDIDAGHVGNTAIGKSDQTPPTNTPNDIPIPLSPALSIDKSAGEVTYSKAGETIHYSYLVTNSGNVTLAGPVTVTDNKATVTCPALDVAGLKPGVSITCTATYTVTQADVDAGSLTNIAYAKSGSTQSPTDTLTIPAVQTPAISLTKAAEEQNYSKVGDIIHYTLVATNTGNVTLTNVSIIDPKLGTLTCTPAQPATLAPGASVTCTGTYTISQSDLDAGKVENLATASGNPPTGEPVKADAGTSVPASQSQGLLLVKTASPTTYDTVGQIINYSYVVTNSGNVTLAGPITVADDRVTVTCPNDGLAPGASITCTASHAITQADLDAGFVTNHATAHAGNVTSNEATATVTASLNPVIMLTKTPTTTGYSKVGDVINYELVATNTGNATLFNGSISDPLLGALTCTPSQPTTLAPGAVLTCKGSFTITQPYLDAGHVSNTATATGNTAGGATVSAQASADVTGTQSPALLLAKSATPATYSKVGDVISYTYLLTNSGNVTLSSPFAVSDDKATVTCPATPTSLAPGESVTCTASYTIKQGDLDSGKVTNTATATAKFGGNTVTSNQAQATVTAAQSLKLELAKTATPSIYDTVGQTISYSYLVTNTGNVSLAGPITVADDKAAVTCPAGGLAPGASITCTASYTITQADLDSGSVTNKATATANGTTSNEATQTVTATQNPALSLTKTATPETYSKVGDVISYSYNLKNTGNVTLSSPFAVSDDKASVTCPATASLAPNATITCTASHTITQGDLDAGSVTNKATATAKFGGNTVTSNEAQATVKAVQGPALTLVKTATPSTYNAVGQTISYSYLVTNSGNVTLVGPVTVTDDKATVTCPALTVEGLKPGASITCTASYTITQGDLDSGSVTNKATATANGTTSNEATQTVTATQNPALSLTKTASPTTYNAVGDKITYSYVVKNTGNVSLAGPVTVSDDKATVTCPAGGLAPNASITCTATYTITQADIDAGSVTNTATATTKFGDKTVTSNQAQTTVTATTSTAKITPTGTTCQQFANGTSAALDKITYIAKGGKINSVSPGVFFYYSKITAPKPDFTITVNQAFDTNWKAMGAMQMVLYDANCNKTQVSGSYNNGIVTFTAKGLTTGATYYIGIKFDANSLVGNPVNKITSNTYTFTTSINGTLIGTSKASINIIPK